MKEYWDSECVDNFEKYWIKELTESEKKTLIELRNKIFNTETNEEEIPKLYREAVEILHRAFARQYPDKKVILRERNEGEESLGIGFYGVSEVI